MTDRKDYGTRHDGKRAERQRRWDEWADRQGGKQ